jgi:uncharacterized protein YoxC
MADQEVQAVIAAVKELTGVVNTLSTTVAVLTSTVSRLVETQEDHEERIRKQEAIPSKKWDKAVGVLIGALITGTIALLFATLQK